MTDMLEGQLYWRVEKPDLWVGVKDGGIMCSVRRHSPREYLYGGDSNARFETLDDALSWGDQVYTKGREGYNR